MPRRRAILAVLTLLSAPRPLLAALKISSPAFQEDGTIPAEYTCDGTGRNPPLVWSDVPAEARSLALVIDDPDAPRLFKADGVFVHWVVWDLPPGGPGLAEGEAKGGVNDNGGSGYTPPCPPDRGHRYVFKLFALDTTLGTTPIANAADLYRAINGHELARAQLVGHYRRPLRWFLILAGVLLVVLTVVLAFMYALFRTARFAIRGFRRSGFSRTLGIASGSPRRAWRRRPSS